MSFIQPGKIELEDKKRKTQHIWAVHFERKERHSLITPLLSNICL